MHLCQYLGSDLRHARLEPRPLRTSVGTRRLVLIIDCCSALTAHVGQAREARCTFRLAILCKHASLIIGLMSETKDTFLLGSRLGDTALTPSKRWLPVSIDSLGRLTHSAETEACLCTTSHRWSEAETLTLIHDANRVSSSLQLSPFRHRKNPGPRVRSLSCFSLGVLCQV